MKNQTLHCCFLICLLNILASCANIEVENVDSQSYFDLSGFVDEEISDRANGIAVKKIVSLNGNSEEKSIEAYDLSEELEILKKYDINKVALSGKYNVNIREDNGFEMTEYLANEDQLKTRSLKVWKRGRNIEKVEVEAQLITLLAIGDQKIIYEPSRSFQMISKDVNKYSNDLMKEILITY